MFFLDNLHQILDHDIDDDIFDYYNDLFVLMAHLHNCIGEIKDSRYLYKQVCRKSGVNIFEEDLVTGDVTSWMFDEEFLCQY
jgi:hypothetical protein